MENFSNKEIDKKIDIELRKKEFEKKYGASFGKTDGNILPELENEWLNSIEQFEQQFEKKENISVWNYLGKPAFKKYNEINQVEISDELNHLMAFMNSHSIILDTLCPVDEFELYRFITEELFVYEMENIRIEGMNTCFTYEDFHPNAEYEICQAFDYFFRMTMAKMKNIGGDGYDLLYIDEKNYKSSNGENIDKNIVTTGIHTFLDTFDNFEIVFNEIKNVAINKDKTDAELTCEINYKGCFNNSSEFIEYKGTGYFQLRPSEYGGWSIYHINMPGFPVF